MNCIVAVYALYLFAYPIHQMIVGLDTFNRENASRPLYLVMIKSTILYSSSVVSSVIWMVLYLSTDIGYSYSVCHSFINGMVLILVHPVENALYKKVCCGPHYLCTLALHVPLSKVHRERAAAARDLQIAQSQISKRSKVSKLTKPSVTESVQKNGDIILRWDDEKYSPTTSQKGTFPFSITVTELGAMECPETSQGTISKHSTDPGWTTPVVEEIEPQITDMVVDNGIVESGSTLVIDNGSSGVNLPALPPDTLDAEPQSSKSSGRRVRFNASVNYSRKSVDAMQLSRQISELISSVETLSSRSHTTMLEALWAHHGVHYISRSLPKTVPEHDKLEMNPSSATDDMAKMERSIVLSFEQTVSSTMQMMDDESYRL